MVDNAAHAFGRIVLHMAHIGVHHFAAIGCDELAKLGGAFHAGGDLRLQIRDVLIGIARGIDTGAEQNTCFCFSEAPLVHQKEIVDQHAFLLDGVAEGRHGARRHPADIGMVPARRDIGGNRPVASKAGMMTVTSGRCEPP